MRLIKLTSRKTAGEDVDGEGQHAEGSRCVYQPLLSLLHCRSLPKDEMLTIASSSFRRRDHSYPDCSSVGLSREPHWRCEADRSRDTGCGHARPVQQRCQCAFFSYSPPSLTSLTALSDDRPRRSLPHHRSRDPLRAPLRPLDRLPPLLRHSRRNRRRRRHRRYDLWTRQAIEGGEPGADCGGG